MTDVFSKYSAVATTNQTSETTAKVLVKEWFSKYRVPQQIHPDEGRNFRVRTDPLSVKGVWGTEIPHNPIPSRGKWSGREFNQDFAQLAEDASPW